MHWTDIVWWSEITLAAGSLMLLTLTSGCSAAGDSGPYSVEDPCSEKFSAETELWEDTREATFEWSQATGRLICMDPAGIPVRLTDEPLQIEDEWECGVSDTYYWNRNHSYAYTTQIQISSSTELNCPSHKEVILHEMGHVLSRIPNNENRHTKRGLMAPHADGSAGIDAEALALICRYFPCR